MAHTRPQTCLPAEAEPVPNGPWSQWTFPMAIVSDPRSAVKSLGTQGQPRLLELRGRQRHATPLQKEELCSRGRAHSRELVERHQEIHSGQSSLHFANIYTRGRKQSKQFPMKCSRLAVKMPNRNLRTAGRWWHSPLIPARKKQRQVDL